MKKPNSISSEIFKKFADNFAFSVVDVIIMDKKNRFLLTKRNITPYKNKWHFPGGVIHNKFTIDKMVKMVAKNEVNLDVEIISFVGAYDIKRRFRHDISHVFLTRILKGDIKLDFQSSDANFFSKPPNTMISFQKKIWHDAKFVLNNSQSQKKSLNTNRFKIL